MVGLLGLLGGDKFYVYQIENNMMLLLIVDVVYVLGLLEVVWIMWVMEVQKVVVGYKGMLVVFFEYLWIDLKFQFKIVDEVCCDYVVIGKWIDVKILM